MKPILALIIFADGAAAFIGAVVASRVRTHDDKRPELIKVLMVGLLGYALARFWNGWNAAAHGQEVVQCVAVQSPDYLWHSYVALSLQAATAWAATIYLISKVMNGHTERVKQRLYGMARWIRNRF